MDTPIIDHRGRGISPSSPRNARGHQAIFKTTNPVIIYTATGTGAWEAALANTLSPGDRVLYGRDSAQFATLWKTMAEKLSLKPEFIKDRTGASAPTPPDRGAPARDKSTEITSAYCTTRPRTGCLSPIPEIRKAIDAAGHPCPVFVDTSPRSLDRLPPRRVGLDVTVGGAQKGLMLPPAFVRCATR